VNRFTLQFTPAGQPTGDSTAASFLRIFANLGPLFFGNVKVDDFNTNLPHLGVARSPIGVWFNPEGNVSKLKIHGGLHCRRARALYLGYDDPCFAALDLWRIAAGAKPQLRIV